MRTLLALLTALAALVLAGVASAAGPTGVFLTKISGKNAQLDGTWLLSIAPNGVYAVVKEPDTKTILIGGQSAVNGKNMAFADKLGPLACKGAAAIGYYTFTLAGKTLTLHVARDRCAGRPAVLASAPFTKGR